MKLINNTSMLCICLTALCISCGVGSKMDSRLGMGCSISKDYEEEKVGNRVVNNLETPASIDFRNEASEAIYVVMDTNRDNRESYTIAAGGQAHFSKANVGDAPVFRVYRSESNKECLFARNVGARGSKSSFTWNGRGM